MELILTFFFLYDVKTYFSMYKLKYKNNIINKTFITL